MHQDSEYMVALFYRASQNQFLDPVFLLHDTLSISTKPEQLIDSVYIGKHIWEKRKDRIKTFFTQTLQIAVC